MDYNALQLISLKNQVDQNAASLGEIVNLGNGVDNYSTIITRDSNGYVSQVQLKYGETIKETTIINRDENGNVTDVSETLNGKTITTTINRDSNGYVTSTSKEVV